MSEASSPPGWYRDPYGEADWRWWDGSSWGAATRAAQETTVSTPVAAAPASRTEASSGASATAAGASSPALEPLFSRLDRGQRHAIIALAVLFLAAAGVVGAAILFTASPSPSPVDGIAGTTTEAPTDDLPEQPAIGDPPAGDEGEDEVDTQAEAEVEDPVEEDDETVVIDFDGVCTVEVRSDDLDDLRPWRFDECTAAPIALADADDERWIVVVASLGTDEFDEPAARERAEEHDLAGNILWSSHYPSLNPNFWVVFDGPFADQSQAEDAAGELGGNAYPRLLTDDDDDRYCRAEDGCERD
jgi:hypothetical protein